MTSAHVPSACLGCLMLKSTSDCYPGPGTPSVMWGWALDSLGLDSQLCHFTVVLVAPTYLSVLIRKLGQ